MININQVTYRYPGRTTPALNKLTLHVESGEAVCVMGPNGCGKSTLAKLVAGLVRPDDGRIAISSSADRRLPVGILFQNPDNQIVAMTVEKEVAFALENLALPMSQMEPMVERLLDRFRIAPLKKRLTSELSGGEKQRLALAAVMVFSPPVLVLDEPDSFLDQQGKQSLRQEIEQLREQYPALVDIRITQYPEVARTYPRLVVIDKGAVVADGDPNHLLSDLEQCLKWGLAYKTSPSGALDESRLPSFNHSVDRREVVARIVFDDAAFCYGHGRAVFKHLALTWETGQAIGVVGPSGSGKSTLGNLVCGLLKATSGAVRNLDSSGMEIEASQMRGQISAAFQQPERQFFLPTCAEEIAFGPVNLGRPLTRAQINDYLTLVGLPPEQFSERDPLNLSGGEKRRLAMAVVLSIGPGFLVVDEPTCGLDQEGVGRFVDLAKRLGYRGVGLMVISHDGNLIRRLTDRVLYLPGDETSRLVSTDRFFDDVELRRVVSPVTTNGV
ncbi:MAG: ATP-binding cassette domain-containing protein [bacterium]